MSSISPSDGQKVPTEHQIEIGRVFTKNAKDLIGWRNKSILHRVGFFFQNIANLIFKGETLFDKVKYDLTTKIIKQIKIDSTKDINKPKVRAIQKAANAWTSMIYDLGEAPEFISLKFKSDSKRL